MQMQAVAYHHPQQAVVAAPPSAVLYAPQSCYVYYPQPLVNAGRHNLQPQSNKWATGICYSCFNSSEDFSLWCLTCWCPCVTFGRIVEIVNRGNTTSTMGCAIYCGLCYFTGFEWIYSGMTRTSLRRQYGLPDTPCPDLLLHCICHKCALRQEYRQLRHQGFNMNLGWSANVQRMTQERAVAHGGYMPPTVQGMTR